MISEDGDRSDRLRAFFARYVAARGHADEVRRRGAEPFYGTTFDNVASQRLAQRSGLRVVASEFSIASSHEPALSPRISDGG